MQTDPIAALRAELPKGAEVLNTDILLKAAEAGDEDILEFLAKVEQALETPEVAEWVLTETLVAKYADAPNRDNWIEGRNLRYRRTLFTSDEYGDPDGFSIGDNVYKSREHDKKYDWDDVVQQDIRHRNANYRTYHHFPGKDVTLVYNSRKGRNPDLAVMWDDKDETPIVHRSDKSAQAAQAGREGAKGKKYANNAERQKAYRARLKCQTCQTDGRDNCRDHRDS